MHCRLPQNLDERFNAHLTQLETQSRPTMTQIVAIDHHNLLSMGLSIMLELHHLMTPFTWPKFIIIPNEQTKYSGEIQIVCLINMFILTIQSNYFKGFRQSLLC